MKRPSRWFLATVVLLVWISLYVGKFSLDVSQMVLPDEHYEDSALGFPFTFLAETWWPGSEQMHSTIHFSSFWLIIDVLIMLSTSILAGQLFGSKMKPKETELT